MTIIIGWQLASSALLIQLPVKRLRSSLGSFTKSEGGSDADGIGGIWDRDQFCECAGRDIHVQERRSPHDFLNCED